MNKYIPTIGIEVHIQVKTETKIFCRCSTNFGDNPNSHICPICTGMPGVMPSINDKVVDLAIKAALALNCNINEISSFARKNYFYPDLPKGYQITQFKYPIAENGYIKLKSGKKIRIGRLHIEEDTGKFIHDKEHESLLDLNRAGVPLIEIVTEPDVSNADEAIEYLKKLRLIIRYCDVSDANMEKGQMRAEPNISIRKDERDDLGVKTEIKNLNSFKAVFKGINSEIKRQSEIIDNNGTIVSTTMLFNEKEQKVAPMRKKETAGDYRYFPEPDLPNLKVLKNRIENIRNEIPELPNNKMKRFKRIFGLREEDIEILISTRELSDFYEHSMEGIKDTQKATNFFIKEFLSLLNKYEINAEEVNFTPEYMKELMQLIENGQINLNAAAKVLDVMQKTGNNPNKIVKELGLEQTGNEEDIKEIVVSVISENREEAERYRNGEEKLFGFLVGQVMKKSKGKADPVIVNKMIKEIL